MDEVFRTASLVAVACGGLVIAAATARALAKPQWAAGERFGSASALAIEFLLAGGLLRLSTLTLPALGIVAAVIAVRQIIARGVSFGRRATSARLGDSVTARRGPA